MPSKEQVEGFVQQNIQRIQEWQSGEAEKFADFFGASAQFSPLEPGEGGDSLDFTARAQKGPFLRWEIKAKLTIGQDGRARADVRAKGPAARVVEKTAKGILENSANRWIEENM